MPVRALENKVIVVIGGTTGMGLSAVKAFLSEGARVVAIGRSDESAQSAAAELSASFGDSSQFRISSADACDPLSASAAIETALSAFGGFNGLYHVAGGSGRKLGDGPLHEITDDGWLQTMNLNITSLFNSFRAAVKQFLKQGGGGSILGMGSVLAFSPEPKHFATHAYAAAKAAAVGLVRSTAAYYAPQKIRINLVAPSLIETPMSARASHDQAILDFIERKQPLGGIGRPEDLDAAAVYFMAEGSRFVTGQVLNIDGGWSVS